MKNLPIKIDLVDDVPMVSTLIVAENVIDIDIPTEQQISKKNRTIRDMIKKNLSDFEEFGGVRFENATLETKGGKQEISYINLNEQQATLLITYLRNNDKVRAFKKNLVKAFFIMKEKIESNIQSTSNTEVLNIVVAQNGTMLEILQNQTKLLEHIVNKEEQKPKTITKEQMKKIRSNTYIIASHILEYDPLQNESELMGRLYRALNAQMGVSSYYDIAYEDFDEAIELQLSEIKKWKEKVKNKDRKESTADDFEFEF